MKWTPVFLLILTFGCAISQPIDYFPYVGQNPISINDIGKQNEFTLQSGNELVIQILAYPYEVMIPGSLGEAVEANSGNKLTFYINENGILDLPIFGEFTLEGLTINEARELIIQRAEKIYKDPSVHLEVVNLVYTIDGNINAAGEYPLSAKRQLSIFEAIAIGGGAKANSEMDRVILMRKTDSGRTIYRLNLLQESILNNQLLYVMPFDYIMIPSK